jgi:UDP:flavonoid glycosyltransferase YjiC (YdhE family)
MAQILPSCALLINHGGQGTVLAALSVGCPQLLLPQFDDQFDNADIVHEVGAGVRLLPDQITPHAVLELATSLIEGARCTAQASRIAEEIEQQPSLPETVNLLAELAGRR